MTDAVNSTDGDDTSWVMANYNENVGLKIRIDDTTTGVSIFDF